MEKKNGGGVTKKEGILFDLFSRNSCQKSSFLFHVIVTKKYIFIFYFIYSSKIKIGHPVLSCAIYQPSDVVAIYVEAEQEVTVRENERDKQREEVREIKW